MGTANYMYAQASKRSPLKCLYFILIDISQFPSLKSRLDMKNNRKCITISLTTSIWNHCLMDIESLNQTEAKASIVFVEHAVMVIANQSVCLSSKF